MFGGGGEGLAKIVFGFQRKSKLGRGSRTEREGGVLPSLV